MTDFVIVNQVKYFGVIFDEDPRGAGLNSRAV
jgi:hypothetical protein